MPIVSGGSVENAVDKTISNDVANRIIGKYSSMVSSTLTDDEKINIKKEISQLPNIEEMSEDDAVAAIMNAMQNASNIDARKMEVAVRDVVSQEFVRITDNGLERTIASVEKKLHKKGIYVNIDQSVKDKVKEAIINEQRTRLLHDPNTTPQQQADLASNKIAREKTSKYIKQTIYSVLSEQSNLKHNNASDTNIEQLLNSIEDSLKKINGINQSNVAKNKQSAIGFGQLIQSMFDYFEEV